jgi:Tfp pilus assembly protein PilX
MMPRPRRRRQHGGVTLLLIVVLILLAALVGALAVRGSFTDLRMSGSERVARTSFYCAEAGLNAARPLVAASIGQWDSMLAGTAPGGQAQPYTGSIQGGIGASPAQYKAWIVDNQDEQPDAPQRDADLTVILISQCIDTSLNGTASVGRELRELVTYGGNGGTDYRYQAGHSSTHSGNEN